MNYFLSAGEASGDTHGADLINAIKKADPDATFTFLGGDAMTRAAGSDPVIHINRMAFMGFGQVISHLPTILGNLSHARKALREARPDALILIDYPSFNFRLARTAAAMGCPIYYFIPPKVWAWKQRRLKSLKEFSRAIFSILPFEPAFYSQHQAKATYVGNPSVNQVRRRLAALEPRTDFIAAHNLTSRPMLALVPGSRLSEIKRNLPIMVAVARRHPDLQAIVAAAPGVPEAFYRRFTTLPLVTDDTLALMNHSVAALVTSGTATLECALCGTPQVVCYRANGSRLSYNLFRRILHIDHVTLPNLIDSSAVVPEMLLHHCTPLHVDAKLSELLDDTPQRQAQLDGYARINTALGSDDAAATAASHIISDLTSPRNHNGHS